MTRCTSHVLDYYLPTISLTISLTLSLTHRRSQCRVLTHAQADCLLTTHYVLTLLTHAQADYPMDTVPNKVEQLFKALQFHERKSWEAAVPP